VAKDAAGARGLREKENEGERTKGPSWWDNLRHKQVGRLTRKGSEKNKPHQKGQGGVKVFKGKKENKEVENN